jgi:hypothetical protein
MIKTAGLVGFAGPAESPIVPWRSVDSGAIAFCGRTGRYCGTKEECLAVYSRIEQSSVQQRVGRLEGTGEISGKRKR